MHNVHVSVSVSNSCVSQQFRTAIKRSETDIKGSRLIELIRDKFKALLAFKSIAL